MMAPLLGGRERWIREQCSGTVLDVGSADGWVFKGNGLDVTCLDVNEYAPNEFPQVVGDAHSLPFDDNSFDCCILAEILEHVHNPILVLKEAARVARKKVVFTVPDEGHWTPDHKPGMTIEERIKESGGLTPTELYTLGNSTCTKVNDPEQTYHHRWYAQKLLESQLAYLGLPYEIKIIAYEGWSWFCGTISKEAITEPVSPPMISTASIKYETLAQPHSLQIDTFPFCNSKCRFCRYLTLTRARSKMDKGLLERILDDTASWPEPLGEIVPVHYGELFLDPDWYDTLKMMETKLPQTGIVVPTNGSLLDQPTVEKLATIKTLSIINLSVNAFFHETYQELMGLDPENIPRIRQAINQLKALRPSVRIWVSMVYSPVYQTELEKGLFKEEWEHYTPEVSIHAASYCHDYFKPAIKTKIPCRSIFVNFVILSDGRVCPCCWDSDGSIIVGDVTRKKILDIWHGKSMNSLRELHNSERRNEVPLCSECTFS